MSASRKEYINKQITRIDVQRFTFISSRNWFFGVDKKQLLSNFFVKWATFGQLLQIFGATFERYPSNLCKSLLFWLVFRLQAMFLSQCKMGLTGLHDFYGSRHLYIGRSLFGHSTFFTPVCNRPSGIFILAGFSEKNHWVGQIPTGSA